MAAPRSLYIAALVAAIGLHLTLAAYFVSPTTLLSDAPITGADYDTHIGQTMRVLEGLQRWKKHWVYDVQLLAGQPEGTIFDADNKAWELWTYVLTECGLTPGRAFNTYPLLVHIASPLIVGTAARLFGLSAWGSLLAGVLAMAVWWFDSWAHWCWWIGMISYAGVSVFYLLPLAMFFRLTTAGDIVSGLGFIPTLAVCLLIHPYSFFMLATPLAAMYLLARRRLDRRHHLIVAAAVLCALAVNAPWLTTAFSHWHYILDSAYFGRTGVDHLLADFFSLLLDPSDSGVIGSRAALRFLCLAASVAAIASWTRHRAPLSAAFGFTFVPLFALGYLGSWIPGAAQMQPYRYVLPLTFLLCIGAAGFAEQLAFVPRGLPGPVRALLIVLALGTIQHVAGDVTYFMADILPTVRPMIDGTPTPLSSTGYPAVMSYRIPQLVEKLMRTNEMSDWVAQHVAKGERVLVDSTHLGERLAWRNQVEVIGGFRHRNIAHSYANFFRRFETSVVDHDTLQTYLRTYAIQWVIAGLPRTEFERDKDLLEPLGLVEGHHVYRVRNAANKVLQGGGNVQGSTNQIEVRDSLPNEPLVLSYHYHEQLVCSPRCRVERTETPFDSVGLLRVPAPHPPDLSITLRY